jgi:hypothetical protein
MIGNRARDRTGPGLVTGLVKGLATVLMKGLVTRTGNRNSDRTGERTGDSIDDRTGDRGLVTGLTRGLATVFVTILTGERTGDSISDRTSLDWDRTSDMIGNRVWDMTGTGFVTGLVREPVTELADLKGRFNKWQSSSQDGRPFEKTG